MKIALDCLHDRKMLVKRFVRLLRKPQHRPEHLEL